MRHDALRRLGRTDLHLTALGFGAGALNGGARQLGQSEARRTVATAFDAGIRYFDTAPLYGYGMSERCVGDALRHRSEPFALSTKVGRLLAPDAPPEAGEPPVPGFPFGIRFDYSYDGVMRSFEASLHRLGLAKIDIALIHDIDAAAHGPDEAKRRYREAMEGAYPALSALRAEGRIAAIGLGVNEWEVCAAAMDDGEFDCFLLAGRYTLLETGTAARFLPACRRRGIGLIIGGPFNSGILATGAAAQGGALYNYLPAPPEILDRVRSIERVCTAYDTPLAVAALQFPLGEPSVASVIPGANSPAQVIGNVLLFDRPIPDGLWVSLQQEGLIHPEAVPPTEARPTGGPSAPAGDAG